jgi:hypothetical protein
MVDIPLSVNESWSVKVGAVGSRSRSLGWEAAINLMADYGERKSFAFRYYSAIYS